MTEQAQEHEENQEQEQNQEPVVDIETGKTFEEVATGLGWANAEDWRGDPEKHIDAEEFVRRGRESMPLMRSNMQRQDEKIERLTAAIAYQNDLHAKEGERMKADFADKMRAAVQEGDTEAYDAAKKSHDAVVDVEAPATTDEPRDAAFAERNSWYNVDPVKTNAAMVESARLQNIAPGLSQEDHEKAIELHIAKEFGAKPVTQKPGSPVTKPRAGGAPASGKTFNQLPDDAKAAFTDFVKSKVFKDTDEDRARYLEHYSWD